MKKLTSVFMALIGSASAIFANPVSSGTAQTVATNFYKQNIGTQISNVVLAYTETSTSGTAIYYVFNVNSNDGFVIVSADDAASPVIGYSNTGNYSRTNISPEFQYWMTHYDKQILNIKAKNIQANSSIKNLWNRYINDLPGTNKIMAAVAPLTQTTWNQSPYYNALCPGGSVTGCVATAMSQIMRYWNYPAHGIGSSCYDDVTTRGFSMNYGTQCGNYASTVYNWSNMPLSISSNNMDVATLNYNAGVSVQMDYSPSGSGAWVIRLDDTICAQTSYVQYFGYDASTIAGYYRSSFSAPTWINMIENELNNSRVVQYAGFGNVGGHTWVCDGYDASNNLHMNWGWGGADDGYYAITALNPGGDQFDSGEEALIGIQPPPIKALFNADPQIGCAGMVVNFTDQSLVPSTSSPVTAWQWTFAGGSPASSTAQNPSITYNTPGTYAVTLKVTNINGSDSLTVTKYIQVTTPSALPLIQGFEGTFPPSDWEINNPNGHVNTWMQNIGIGGYGKSGHSIYYNNCTGGNEGQYDQLYSPTYDFTTDAAPEIYFDVAYTPYNTTYSDTLAVYYSTDCGKTFTNIYLKGGMALCTNGGTTVENGANVDSTGCFVPLNNQWRTDTVKIPAIAGAPNVMFSFENRSGNGSTMYVDNINIPGIPLGINVLTENNELNVYPNPNNGNFSISFGTQSGKEYDLSIYNVVGQQVMHDVVQNSSSSYLRTVDLSQYGKGIYTVILKSDNQQVVKKVAVF